jgi:hypothetical protein
MSGAAANILSELSNMYPKIPKFCMVQHPSSAFCFDSSLNIYNDILSINSLIEDAEIVASVDDMSLIDVCAKRSSSMLPPNSSGYKVFKKQRPTLEDANNLFVDAMLGITQSLRLPCT